MIVLTKKRIFLAAYLIFFPYKNMLLSWHLFLKNNTLINSQDVTVRDFGNIYSSQLPVSERNILLNTKLKYFPNESRRLNKNDVEILFNENGLNPESIRGSEIFVQLSVKNITNMEISNLLIKKHNLIANSDYQIFVPEDLVLPEFLEYEIYGQFSSRPGKKEAYVRFDNPAYREKIILYEIRKKNIIFKTVENIKAGTRLSKQSYIKEVMFSADPKLLAKQQEPAGFMVMNDLGQGSIIFPENIKKVIDVKAGDLLKLNYKSRNISITFLGYAAQSGSIGQIIKFKTEKNKFLIGEIVSKKNAIITDRIN